MKGQRLFKPSEVRNCNNVIAELTRRFIFFDDTTLTELFMEIARNVSKISDGGSLEEKCGLCLTDLGCLNNQLEVINWLDLPEDIIAPPRPDNLLRRLCGSHFWQRYSAKSDDIDEIRNKVLDVACEMQIDFALTTRANLFLEKLQLANTDTPDTKKLIDILWQDAGVLAQLYGASGLKCATNILLRIAAHYYRIRSTEEQVILERIESSDGEFLQQAMSVRSLDMLRMAAKYFFLAGYLDDKLLDVDMLLSQVALTASLGIASSLRQEMTNVSEAMAILVDKVQASASAPCARVRVPNR